MELITTCYNCARMIRMIVFVNGFDAAESILLFLKSHGISVLIEEVVYSRPKLAPRLALNIADEQEERW
jgi:hypothetical protein